MAISPLVVLRTLFAVLGCVMVATLIYTISIDGLPFRKDLLTPWMKATLIDFYINVVALAVWFSYKETSWLSKVFWIAFLVCLGSIATCAYITVQLFKLSNEESMQDLICHLLLQQWDKWLTATLIDFYINVTALSVWVGYKESSWAGRFAWITLLICFGSIFTCAYIVRELFQLSAYDPLYIVLLNKKDRAGSGYEKAPGTATFAARY